MAQRWQRRRRGVDVAIASPMRADVPSLTSMMAPSCPVDIGPETWSDPDSQGLSVAKIAAVLQGQLGQVLVG